MVGARNESQTSLQNLVTFFFFGEKKLVTCNSYRYLILLHLGYVW